MAIALVIVFAVVVFHALPAMSTIPPGSHPWNNAKALVLPVATLAIVIAPYIFRMVRGAMIEAMESDYVEMAELKGSQALARDARARAAELAAAR